MDLGDYTEGTNEGHEYFAELKFYDDEDDYDEYEWLINDNGSNNDLGFVMQTAPGQYVMIQGEYTFWEAYKAARASGYQLACASQR
ncbi:MAG UNVERIFIED_CONTAM: hypothetical protein LVR18_45795 [Planctomycetaceae bacterium]